MYELRDALDARQQIATTYYDKKCKDDPFDINTLVMSLTAHQIRNG